MVEKSEKISFILPEWALEIIEQNRKILEMNETLMSAWSMPAIWFTQTTKKK